MTILNIPKNVKIKRLAGLTTFQSMNTRERKVRGFTRYGTK